MGLRKSVFALVVGLVLAGLHGCGPSLGRTSAERAHMYRTITESEWLMAKDDFELTLDPLRLPRFLPHGAAQAVHPPESVDHRPTNPLDGVGVEARPHARIVAADRLDQPAGAIADGVFEFEDSRNGEWQGPGDPPDERRVLKHELLLLFQAQTGRSRADALFVPIHLVAPCRGSRSDMAIVQVAGVTGQR